MSAIASARSRDGLNEKQKAEIINLLQKDLDDGFKIQVTHGDCVGADNDFHNICRSLKPSIKNEADILIHIRPGGTTNNNFRAFCKGDFHYYAKPFLERNKDIVNNCDILLACPRSNVEELRSGTWATIRYANTISKPTKIIV